jgi:hypothetical protein
MRKTIDKDSFTDFWNSMIYRRFRCEKIIEYIYESFKWLQKINEDRWYSMYW